MRRRMHPGHDPRPVIQTQITTNRMTQKITEEQLIR